MLHSMTPETSAVLMAMVQVGAGILHSACTHHRLSGLQGCHLIDALLEPETSVINQLAELRKHPTHLVWGSSRFQSKAGTSCSAPPSIRRIPSPETCYRWDSSVVGVVSR